MKKTRVKKAVLFLAVLTMLILTALSIINFDSNVKKEVVYEACHICEDKMPINHVAVFIEDEKKKRLEELTAEDNKRKEEAKQAEIARVEAERKHKEALEAERLRRLEEKKKKELEKVIVSRSNEYKGVNESLGTFNVSWYGADCKGCSGQTSTGVWVNKTIYYQGYGVAASDWSVIPPYSIIEVEGYGRYIVLDKGGAIKSKRLDLLTTSEAKSNEYGRQHLNVTVLRWGK